MDPIHSPSWTFLDSHTEERTYSSYAGMGGSSHGRGDVKPSNDEQSGHPQCFPREDMPSSLGNSGRRKTTDLDVLTTLSPLGLCRLLIPGDGACMVRYLLFYLFLLAQNVFSLEQLLIICMGLVRGIKKSDKMQCGR